jgi:hypothetical protein
MRGVLEKSGFKQVELVDSGGQPVPSKGQISEDGRNRKKMIIDDGSKGRVTLTRKK